MASKQPETFNLHVPDAALADLRERLDIRRWSVMPRGGHFAAMEQPEALAQEIRELFRPLRSE